MTGRTVIIASHAVEALAPLAQHAVFLDSGGIAWQGTGDKLLNSEHMAHLKTDESTTRIGPEEVDPGFQAERRRSSVADLPADILDLKEAIPKTPRQLIIDEDRAKGAVDLHHWRDLSRFNGSRLFWTSLVLVMSASCLAPVAERRVLE